MNHVLIHCYMKLQFSWCVSFWGEYIYMLNWSQGVSDSGIIMHNSWLVKIHWNKIKCARFSRLCKLWNPLSNHVQKPFVNTARYIYFLTHQDEKRTQGLIFTYGRRRYLNPRQWMLITDMLEKLPTCIARLSSCAAHLRRSCEATTKHVILNVIPHW